MIAAKDRSSNRYGRRLLYAYSTHAHPEANSIQMLNTLQALSCEIKITYIAPWGMHSFRRFARDTLGEPLRVTIAHCPIPYVSRKGIATHVSRFAYGLYCILYAIASGARTVYTRDISLPLVLSYMPRAIKRRVNVVVEMHKVYHRISRGVSFRAERRALSVATGLVPTGPLVAEDIRRCFRTVRIPMKVARNGVNLRRISSLAAASDELLSRYGFGQRPFFVYSGSLEAWKGVDTLLEAAALLVAEEGFDIVIIGGNASQGERGILPAAIQDSGRFHLVGRLPWYRTLQIVKRASIGVIPNGRTPEGERYTQPIKLMEYLACGLPIIASNLPSLRTVLSEPANCLFFDPDNAFELSRKMLRLISDRSARKTMSRSNLRLAATYDWSRRAERIRDFLDLLEYDSLEDLDSQKTLWKA